MGSTPRLISSVSGICGPEREDSCAKGSTTKGLGWLERKFKALLGKKGEEFWDQRLQELTQPPPRDMGAFSQEELKREQERFNKEVGKLSSGPTQLTGKKHVYARLTKRTLPDTVIGRWLLSARFRMTVVLSFFALWGYATIRSLITPAKWRITR